MRLEASAEHSDWTPEELAALDPKLVHFKSEERWRALYDAVKGESKPEGRLALSTPSFGYWVLPAPEDASR